MQNNIFKKGFEHFSVKAAWSYDPVTAWFIATQNNKKIADFIAHRNSFMASVSNQTFVEIFVQKSFPQSFPSFSSYRHCFVFIFIINF